jgi:hypothetical protein
MGVCSYASASRIVGRRCPYFGGMDSKFGQVLMDNSKTKDSAMTKKNRELQLFIHFDLDTDTGVAK